MPSTKANGRAKRPRIVRDDREVIQFEGLALQRWQWRELTNMIDLMKAGSAKIGIARVLESGIRFLPLEPCREKLEPII